MPAGGRAARRVENRLPGADSNPYLAIAGSLLANRVSNRILQPMLALVLAFAGYRLLA